MNQGLTGNSLDTSINTDKKAGFFKTVQKRITNSQYSYLAYCFIIPVIIMYFVYVAMQIHPFGDGSVLVLDLNGQYVYFYEALRNAVYGEGSLFYSFYRALGGEFMGIYAYYLASPLSYIVALFPQHRILEALLTIILIKTGLCGFTFGFYLHKNSKAPNKMMVITFSVMYALCAFAIVHQNNMMWTDTLIWLPILTYGIESLVKYRKYKLYVVALALTLMSNYYIGYMACIYCVAYFFYYSYANPKELLNPEKKKNFTFRSFVRFGTFSVLAAAIAAFVILAAYYSLTFGKSTFSNPSWALEAKFGFLEFFTKFLPGSYDTVRPSGLPFVYTGVLTIFMIPVYFMAKNIPTREKIASLCFIVFFVSSFIIRPFDLVWHGFQTPNWLNYRYSFMFSFFLLTISYKAFGNLRKIGEKFILGICVILILFVAVCEKLEFETYVENESKLLTFETVWLTVIAALFMLVTLCLLIRTKGIKKRENITSVLAAVICIEIFCSALTCVVQFDGDVLYSGYSGYNDFLKKTRPVISELKEYDSSFYRFEKLDHRKLNDNMALSIRGLSNSTSTLNADTLVFLNNMGYLSRSHLSQYYGGNPVNDSLLGIKYIIDKKASNTLTHTYDSVVTEGEYTAYLNPYALSIAYGVDDDLAEYKFDDNDTKFEKLNKLVTAMLGEDSELPLFVPENNVTTTTKNCDVTPTANQTAYASKSSSTKGTITYSITASADGEYYFHTPASKTNETTLQINGKTFGNYLGSNSNHIVPLGWYSAGSKIEVTIKLKENPITLLTDEHFVWYLDDEAFKDAFEQLGDNPQYDISDDYKEDHFNGTITTEKDDQMILTSLPYDKGWKIYLDGEKVETYETLDALVAFDIADAGEHTLEMRYLPDIYVLGMIVSALGIIVFIALCVLEFVMKKKGYVLFPAIVTGDDKWLLEDFDIDDEEMKALPPEPTKKNKKKKSDTSNNEDKVTDAEVPSDTPMADNDALDKVDIPESDDKGEN